MFKKEYKKKIFIVGGLLAVVILVISLKEAGVQVQPQEAAAMIKSWGIIAPLIYTGIIVINVVIPPVSHVPFMLVMLKVFGFWTTFASLLVGHMVGAGIAFLLAKRYGRPLVLRLVGLKGMKKVDELTSLIGWQAILILRLFAGTLFDYVSYAAGLTSITFRAFMATTFIGGLPGSIAFVYFVEKSFVLLPVFLVWSYILTSLSLAFLFWQAKRVQAKRKIGA